MQEQPRICDYEDSSYRSDFWEGQGREYEDLAERIALRRLLPPTGQRLIDIGGGFGRLSEFYERFQQVVLLDYSRSLLREAQSRLGRGGRMTYVAASFYAMPFAGASFDGAMMVRVMHHVERVGDLLREVSRVLAGSGTFVLEYANKRHLKSMLRYALGRQAWSPYEPAPYEFVEMNFDFHPSWMRDRLVEAMFHVKRTRTVSHFRQPLLKQLVPARALATLDGAIQPTGAWWQLTPSVFVECGLARPAERPLSNLRFRCPACGCENLEEVSVALECTACGCRWPIEDGILNFKEASRV
jgi:ubiquinone/menaquinone biosynthesis C-methylase UbiE